MPSRRLLAHLDALGVVPVTLWTAVILVFGLLVTAGVWRGFAAATGWGPAPTVVAGLWLSVIAALTLGPGGGSDVERAGCTPTDESVADVLAEVGHDLESALNAVLLGPLAVALVLASRRMLTPVLVVVVLPALIEVAQVFIPGRFCSPADYVLNVAGGLAGVGVTGVVVLVRRRRAGRRE